MGWKEGTKDGFSGGFDPAAALLSPSGASRMPILELDAPVSPVVQHLTLSKQHRAGQLKLVCLADLSWVIQGHLPPKGILALQSAWSCL